MLALDGRGYFARKFAAIASVAMHIQGMTMKRLGVAVSVSFLLNIVLTAWMVLSNSHNHVSSYTNVLGKSSSTYIHKLTT